MPFSEYVRSLRARIGHDLLLLPDQDEVVEVGWFTRAEIAELPHPVWVDRMLADV